MWLVSVGKYKRGLLGAGGMCSTNSAILLVFTDVVTEICEHGVITPTKLDRPLYLEVKLKVNTPNMVVMRPD